MVRSTTLRFQQQLSVMVRGPLFALDAPEDVYVRKAGEVLYAAREPLGILERMRRSQGSLTFSAQYQQALVPPEGKIVKRECVRPNAERPTSFDQVIARWDTRLDLSETAEYSVGTIWGAKGLDFYPMDLVREHSEVLRLSEAWLAGWMEELLAFPNGRHDDQVDATSQALDYLTAFMYRIHAD